MVQCYRPPGRIGWRAIDIDTENLPQQCCSVLPVTNWRMPGPTSLGAAIAGRRYTGSHLARRPVLRRYDWLAVRRRVQPPNKKTLPTTNNSTNIVSTIVDLFSGGFIAIFLQFDRRTELCQVVQIPTRMLLFSTLTG